MIAKNGILSARPFISTKIRGHDHDLGLEIILTLKGHNFLILIPLFMIYILLERYLSILSKELVALQKSI